MRRSRGKETDLVRQVLDYLALRKVWAWRVNVGALRDSTGRVVFFGAKGHPDIIARLKPVGYTGFSGRVVWIECKSPKGKMSEAQKEWREKAITYGDLFIVARSLDDVRQAFE